MTQQTSVEWLEERLTLSLGDEIKYLRGFFVIAKEMHKKEITKTAVQCHFEGVRQKAKNSEEYLNYAEEHYNQLFKTK